MSHFLNFGFSNLTVLFICFSCCFSQNYDYENLNDTDQGQEIVFRVIGGTAAKLGEVPYQIAFRGKYKQGIYITFCGGTIIDEQKIVSAAHCFHAPYVSNCFNRGRAPKKKIIHYFAVAGTLRNRDVYHREDSTEHGQWRRLRTVYYPASYKFPKHDIAVVFVNKPFNFNDNINKIPIASFRMEYSGECLVSGFGRMGPKLASPILYTAKLEIIPTLKCNKIHHSNMRHFICTSAAVSDVHKGDSGGPLVCKEGSTKVLAGVVSGNRKTIRGHGSFFTRVSSYHTYITTHNSSCKVNIYKWVLILINSAYLLF